MPEEQLERSILERKERDELQAIASALSLKPVARSKKSDIIDLILGSAAPEDRMRRTDRAGGAKRKWIVRPRRQRHAAPLTAACCHKPRTKRPPWMQPSTNGDRRRGRMAIRSERFQAEEATKRGSASSDD